MTPATNSRLWLALMALGACFPAAASDTEVKAGGVVLIVPAPVSDFVESGDKLRTTFFELLVPSSNRLLSAYLPEQKFAELNAGKASGGLEVYAMLEAPRRAEYSDCTPQAFEQVLKSVGPTMGGFDAKKLQDLQDEMNIRLKSLATKPIELGHPEMLGGIFQKSDAAGFAMLTASKEGEHSVTMAGGFAVLRVKQRLIFAYLYRRYESPDTVGWLRKSLEAWCDAILASNK